MASFPSNGYNEVMSGTNNYTGSNFYGTSCPKTPIVPVANDDLTNKLYVDTATGGGIIGSLTDKGSLITANGTNAVIFDQNPYQTALTTTTVYEWSALALGQSRAFTTTVPTLIPLGSGITITYSGTDSIKGNVTSVVGTTITITITALASAAYVATTVYTSNPPAGVLAGSLTAPFNFSTDPTVSTPNPPIIPANTMITDGISFIHNVAGVPPTFIVNLISDPANVVLGTSTPTPTSNFPAPNNFQFADGAFVSTATLFIFQITGFAGGVNFQYPIGGGFVPADYCGQLNGYSLAYSTGSIVIDDDIALIADATSATGLAWGVINTASIGAVTSVSGGVNIVMSGTIPAPIVNLRNPLTAELNMGSQSLRDSASAVGTSGQVLSAGAGGQTLWSSAVPSASIAITDTNTNATFYPTFVAGAGVQSLLADIATTQISLNPSNGNFNVVDTLKLTQSELAIGKGAGNITQATNAIAVGLNAGQTNQAGNCVAIGGGSGALNQQLSAVAVGSGAGNTTQGQFTVAIGVSSGSNTQGTSAIAIGNQAGFTTQGAAAVAIGVIAGNNNQGGDAVAVGNGAGTTSQGANSVAVGGAAGGTSQGTTCVAVGASAGQTSQGVSAVAIGSAAGSNTQSTQAVAVGAGAGITTQGQAAVAVGLNAGAGNQGANAVAIGRECANTNQGASSVAIGNSAGQTQGASCVAIGFSAGATNQATQAVAIGVTAGQNSQGVSAVAIGLLAGSSTQGTNGVAIGQNAGLFEQGANAIAIGINAGAGVSGTNFQGANAVAIGNQAGENTQGSNSVAVGNLAAETTQGIRAVAVGFSAGQTTQGQVSVAIGSSAGAISQGANNVAIGGNAGSSTQGASSVAVGSGAGRFTQGSSAVAVGTFAGGGVLSTTFQGNGAVAIGTNAGQGTTTGQGANAVAIGLNAGVASQTAGSICLNASGVALNPNQAGCFVRPIRGVALGLGVGMVFYDAATFELQYSTT